MNCKGKYRLFSGLAVLCAGAALMFGGKVFMLRQGYERGEADLERARAAYARTSDPGSGGRTALERLRDQNEDVIGWLRIGETPIDYPVMQTRQEPDYYLSRGFDRKRSAYGSIYMEAACRLDGSCRNYILYGHHMRNGAMFGSLKRYASEDYLLAHGRIEFSLLDEGGEYEILAVFKTTAKGIEEIGHCLTAETEEDYDAFMAYCKKHTLRDTGVTASWPDQLLTLATCEYTQKDGRLFVVAKQIISE